MLIEWTFTATVTSYTYENKQLPVKIAFAEVLEGLLLSLSLSLTWAITRLKQIRWQMAERAVIIPSLVSARCDSTA